MKLLFPRLLLCSLFVVLLSCSDQSSFQMATSTQSASYLQVGEDLSELVRVETNLNIDVLSNENMGSEMNIHMLSENKVDFALAQGDTKIQGEALAEFKRKNHIKTILPLYPEVLFIIHPDSIQADNLVELVRGRKVGLGPENGGTANFMLKLFEHFGIDSSMYTPVYTSYKENIISNKIDISCALTGYNNLRITQMLVQDQHKIFSLGNPELAFKGSSVDGFCLVHGPARPFILPKYTYMNQPERPILTVAVDAILFTHDKVDKYKVYQITETIFKNKQYLGNKNQLLANIRENFDLNDLNYPLHEGARMYLERDKPTFIERYSKLIGSVIVALVTGIPMAINWYKRRRKDQIDRFYKAVLDEESKIHQVQTEEELQAIRQKIYSLRNKAFHLLIDERLDANPAFRIFTDLLQETSRQIDMKAQELKNN